MTFHELLAADVDDVFYNTDEMADTLMYYPKHGTPREITVIYTPLSPRTEDIQSHHELQRDVTEFRTRNNDTNGMTNPQRGDAIRLLTEAATVRWDFLHGDNSQDGAEWTVQFKKQTMQRAGHAVAPQL